MTSAQLKAWLCSLGIAFWMLNNGWEQNRERSRESSRSEKLWIPHVCSERAGRVGKKTNKWTWLFAIQGSCRKLSIWRVEIPECTGDPFRMVILIPEIWEPDDNGPGPGRMWKALHCFVSGWPPELFAKFGPQRLLLFPNPRSLPQAAMTNHYLRCKSLEFRAVPPCGWEEGAAPHYNYWRCFENLLQISERIYPKGSAEWHWEEVHGTPMSQWGLWFLMLYF